MAVIGHPCHESPESPGLTTTATACIVVTNNHNREERTMNHNADMDKGIRAYIAMKDAGVSTMDALDALSANHAVGLGDTWGYTATDESVTFADYTAVAPNSGIVLCTA